MNKEKELEDQKLKEYIEKGILDRETLELVPIRPKSPEELEIEMIEKSLGTNVGTFYRWYLGVPPAENQSS